MPNQSTILALLQAFQDGYTHRDQSQVDAFMELFTPDAEIIGTNGTRPGEGEWYMDRNTARELVEGDWEGWATCAWTWMPHPFIRSAMRAGSRFRPRLPRRSAMKITRAI